jgi:hypothetical protein
VNGAAVENFDLIGGGGSLGVTDNGVNMRRGGIEREVDEDRKAYRRNSARPNRRKSSAEVESGAAIRSS